MNQFPDDDRNLTRFLRQYSSRVPPAEPDLEDRILETIQATEQVAANVVHFRAPMRRSRSDRWLLPAGIAASLIAGLVSYRLALRPQPSATELASLEDFIENNWQNTVSNNSEGEFPIAESTAN